MNISPLLSRLERVKTTGPGRWIACCPAHEDHHPSLALRETDDGRILIHCFAGCETLDILQKLDLNWEDLFPERLPIGPGGPVARPFLPADILACLSDDLIYAALVAARLYFAESISEQEKERLLQCAERLSSAANSGARHGQLYR